jgi:hypothetical protein
MPISKSSSKSTVKRGNSRVFQVANFSRMTGAIVGVVVMAGAYLVFRTAQAVPMPMVEFSGAGPLPHQLSKSRPAQYRFNLPSTASASQVCVMFDFKASDKLDRSDQIIATVPEGKTRAAVLGADAQSGRACFLDRGDIGLFFKHRAVRLYSTQGTATVTGVKAIITAP